MFNKKINYSRFLARPNIALLFSNNFRSHGGGYNLESNAPYKIKMIFGENYGEPMDRYTNLW